MSNRYCDSISGWSSRMGFLWSGIRAAGSSICRGALVGVSAAAAAKATPGPTAARSQDRLYGDDGLP